MTLKAYLALLATDINQLNAFISDPSGATKKIGLSAEDCEKLSGAESNIHDERLVAIGTGIRSVGQFSTEAIAWLKTADKVLYVVRDPVAEEVITTINPRGAESLAYLYSENKERMQTYREMIDVVLDNVRSGKRVCFAVYGHPGVLVYPTHESIRRARAEGYKARMLPAISAEDCLFADLSIDPVAGCQSFEATDFLMNARYIDPYSHILLWQIGGLGDSTYKRNGFAINGMPQLVQKLMRYYRPEHLVYLYEAAILPGIEPLIQSGPLGFLPHVRPTPSATLYIPPVSVPPRDMTVWHT